MVCVGEEGEEEEQRKVWDGEQLEGVSEEDLLTIGSQNAQQQSGTHRKR